MFFGSVPHRFDATGSEQNFKSFSGSTMSSGSGTFRREELRTLESVKDSQLGMGDKQDYFSCRATIQHIKNENLSYPACQTENCNKKVIETHEGWRCEKCDRSFERPEHRYVLNQFIVALALIVKQIHCLHVREGLLRPGMAPRVQRRWKYGLWDDRERANELQGKFYPVLGIIC